MLILITFKSQNLFKSLHTMYKFYIENIKIFNNLNLVITKISLAHTKLCDHYEILFNDLVDHVTTYRWKAGI